MKKILAGIALVLILPVCCGLIASLSQKGTTFISGLLITVAIEAAIVAVVSVIVWLLRILEI